MAMGFSVTPVVPAVQITPNSGQSGQRCISVAVTGSNTHFLQGATAISFGAGVTVTALFVTDATHATAVISVAGGATAGARDVTVTTGTEIVSLASGFAVTISQQGTFGYVVAPGDGGTFVFRRDPQTGVLAVVSGSPFGPAFAGIPTSRSSGELHIRGNCR